jgi:hypothetical protein
MLHLYGTSLSAAKVSSAIAVMILIWYCPWVRPFALTAPIVSSDYTVFAVLVTFPGLNNQDGLQDTVVLVRKLGLQGVLGVCNSCRNTCNVVSALVEISVVEIVLLLKHFLVL